jgi:hypothetical protein
MSISVNYWCTCVLMYLCVYELFTYLIQCVDVSANCFDISILMYLFLNYLFTYLIECVDVSANCFDISFWIISGARDAFPFCSIGHSFKPCHWPLYLRGSLKIPLIVQSNKLHSRKEPSFPNCCLDTHWFRRVRAWERTPVEGQMAWPCGTSANFLKLG